MSYTLTSTLAEGYLRIRIEGEWPRTKSEDIIKGIRNLSEQHSCDTLLLDMRGMESPARVIDDYNDVKKFIDSGFQKYGRIAVLDTQNRREANNFFETAAINRGLIVRFFYGDEEEAISWLLKKEQDQE